MRQISPTVSRQNGCEIVGDFSVDREVDKAVDAVRVFGCRSFPAPLVSSRPRSRRACKPSTVKPSNFAVAGVSAFGGVVNRAKLRKAARSRKNAVAVGLSVFPSLPLPSVAWIFALCRSFSLSPIWEYPPKSKKPLQAKFEPCRIDKKKTPRAYARGGFLYFFYFYYFTSFYWLVCVKNTPRFCFIVCVNFRVIYAISIWVWNYIFFHFLPLSKFRNYCQISVFRGVRLCALLAVLKVF